MFEVRQELLVDEIDLSDLEFWSLPIEVREGAYLTLRNERPIAYFEEMDLGFWPQGPGYYAISRFNDVVEVSRNPEIFSSASGATTIVDLPQPFLDYFGGMINADDPKHGRLRRIVLRAFTPRRLALIEREISKCASDLIDIAREKGEFDFVTEVAAQLPLRIICDMMGIPSSQYQLVLKHSNVILGVADPEFVAPGEAIDQALFNAGYQLSQLMSEIGTLRRKNPSDDITSALVNAELDGEALSGEELASFFVLLIVAGNETTRNAIAWGAKLLSENGDARRRWEMDFDSVTPTAVEEIVRYASPVIFMRRTLLRDYQLAETMLKQGEKVILLYGSANKDERVFVDPFKFDVTRIDNRHLGFGGYGPHYCLGAHLARREISAIFGQIFEKIPNLHPIGDPERLKSNFINGIKHMRVSI